MGTLFNDLKFATRILLRSPLYAAVSILTLALAIGANTAIFTVVHGVLIIGLIEPFALTRFMSSLLYGVSVLDAATFAGVSLVLMVVASAVCYLPARRASRVEPSTMLR